MIRKSSFQFNPKMHSILLGCQSGAFVIFFNAVIVNSTNSLKNAHRDNVLLEIHNTNNEIFIVIQSNAQWVHEFLLVLRIFC